MSAAIQLLNEATSQGIHITVADGSLKCRSDQPIPEEIIGKLQINKTNILDFLTREPVRNTWLDSNLDRLQAAGFTHDDIYREKLPIGIALLDIWDRPGLKVQLIENVLCWTRTNAAGREITQRAWPENH